MAIFTVDDFTLSRLGAPEWKFEQGFFAKPEDGAELWEVFNNGKEELKAIYDKSKDKFIPAK